MNNKVTVPNPKHRLLKLVMFLLLLAMVLSIAVLFTFRTLDTRNYSGNVRTVSGTVVKVEYDDDVTITLNNGVTYNANRIANCYPDIELKELENHEVNIYVPQSQAGKRTKTWILGIEQGDNTIIDYQEVIAEGKAEAKQAMIICGVIAGVMLVATVGVYLIRMRISPTKEEELYKQYCEIYRQRQPSCREYKYMNVALLVYLALTVIVAVVAATVCASVESLTAQIAVAAVMCFIFLGATVAFLLLPLWLLKKERTFYIENFPFDFTDISHVAAHGRQKKFKEELQKELLERRQKFPNRYFDAGNGYEVEFTENGVQLLEENDDFLTPDDVFTLENDASAQQSASVLGKLSYQQLNLEALPYYRKKNHPLSVVIKSRIVDSSQLPEGMTNDVHFMLDSNLLTTLQRFDVQVENLKYILDNKEKLIMENCTRRKNHK